MVGRRRLANDHDFDDDDSAYLQQHTRNSAALERRGGEGELLLATTAT